MTDLHSWLVLLRAPSLSRQKLRELLDHFGGPKAILEASATKLQRHGLERTTITALRHPGPEVEERDLPWLAGEGHHLITWGAPGYPELLARIPDPPMALFVAGDPDSLSLPQLAIVGSRNPSTPGRETAFQFARHLSGCGLSIVSGLALGIDAAGHEGALAAGGITVAVCGTGPDQIYPEANRSLHERIVASGAVVSEYPPGTAPRRIHFPQRNRLISGLALGTLVVEASLQSGSLITARLASEQGREVFAVPGSIHNPLARGCHKLIRDGAKLAESSRDILEELGPLAVAMIDAVPDESPAAGGDPARGPDPEYQTLLDALSFEPVPIDSLVERTGLTSEEVSSMLLILELNGYVEAVPGGGYARLTKRG